ncbi:DUF2182 domain-containing protein [Paroceanicella profunda]|uniref:DUF2182 domain-containing protein n=1 Tax=Paroceanicella profunda TaxID=2579971 RepID=A0A5B8FFY9_9RHOB|nr:DUF2182 domain-containing protein [Paroceanicella profunda]QDL90561.1 DUF2182 domain-containing protein [Paroceanicella profunda]
MPGIEGVLRRDTLLVAAPLALLFLLCALYTLFGVGMEMTAIEMTGGLLPPRAPAGADMAMAPATGAPGTGGMGGMAPVAPLLLFLMWWLMMIAMMLPAAAPVVLLYAALLRRTGAERVAATTAGFVAGYLACWAGFSLAAALAQGLLVALGLVSPAGMALTASLPAGGLLVAAGLFQFTPLKAACLTHCRSPAAFLAGRGLRGPWGAARLGLVHGAYCLGCCWALMALLFVGGVMNLYWIAGLALFVALEKLAPGGRRIARIAGAALVLGGGAMIAGAL